MPFRHPAAIRHEAVALVRSGMLPRVAATAVGVKPTTVYTWLHEDAPQLVRQSVQRCWRCRPTLETDPGDDAELLGLYLGDGCLARTPRGAWFLAISCDDAWPALATRCEEIMRAVLAESVCRVRRPGCQDIKSYSQHWPCLFPQHGPGKKHQRRIVLEPWPQQVVLSHPGRLLRGLFHSDGWRGQNVSVKRNADGTITRYRYARYEFTNKSDDIRGLCTDALDLLDIPWRHNGAWRISVARREAVAALDEHVGPKH